MTELRVATSSTSGEQAEGKVRQRGEELSRIGLAVESINRKHDGEAIDELAVFLEGQRLRQRRPT